MMVYSELYHWCSMEEKITNNAHCEWNLIVEKKRNVNFMLNSRWLGLLFFFFNSESFRLSSFDYFIDGSDCSVNTNVTIYAYYVCVYTMLAPHNNNKRERERARENKNHKPGKNWIYTVIECVATGDAEHWFRFFYFKFNLGSNAISGNERLARLCGAEADTKKSQR